jgi:hypothetical protein
MSFLAKLLTDTLIGGMASSRSNLPKLIIGLLAIIGATVMLFYWLSWKPATVESYYVTEISYSNCYYDRKSKERKIILESGEKEYRIYYYIWQDHYEPDIIVRELSNYSRAKVWLTAKDEPDIRGIASPTLTIEPSVGVAWDRSNRKAMFWVMLGFFVGGCGLVAITLYHNRAA